MKPVVMGIIRRKNSVPTAEKDRKNWEWHISEISEGTRRLSEKSFEVQDTDADSRIFWLWLDFGEKTRCLCRCVGNRKNGGNKLLQQVE